MHPVLEPQKVQLGPPPPDLLLRPACPGTSQGLGVRTMCVFSGKLIPAGDLQSPLPPTPLQPSLAPSSKL
jgi:hypothetical protein